MHNSVLMYILGLAESGLYISIARPKPHKKTVIRMFDGDGLTVCRKVKLKWRRIDDDPSLDRIFIDLLSDMKQEMFLKSLDQRTDRLNKGCHIIVGPFSATHRTDEMPDFEQTKKEEF